MPAPASEPRDRRAKLHTLATSNGIEFIEIANAEQTKLRVRFLEPDPGESRLKSAVTAATISGGETIPGVAVEKLSWSTTAAGLPVAEIDVAEPGDFSTYTFTLVAD